MNEFDWRGTLALGLLALVVTSLFLGLLWGLVVIAVQDYQQHKRLEYELRGGKTKESEGGR